MWGENWTNEAQRWKGYFYCIVYIRYTFNFEPHEGLNCVLLKRCVEVLTLEFQNMTLFGTKVIEDVIN